MTERVLDPVRKLRTVPFALPQRHRGSPARRARTWLIAPRDAAIFLNWIPIRTRIERCGLAQNMNVVVDLSNTRLVDHTVMARLREMEREFDERGIALAVVGLDEHVALSHHPAAARLRGVHREAAEEAGELVSH